MANKWRYDFDCSNCSMIQYINDPKHHREGNYCIAHIERGSSPIHADDDFVLRCDCYSAKLDQMSLFDV